MFKVLLLKLLCGALCFITGEQLGAEFDTHKPEGSF
jgi:hypothetical protein